MTYLTDPTGFVIPQYMDYALAAVRTEYASHSDVTLPERNYWTIGGVAADCEQAVLIVQQHVLGSAGAPIELTQCNAPRSLTFLFQVLRCVTVASGRGSRPPESSAIQADSVTPTQDMEIMMDLATSFDTYNQGIIVTIDAVVAEGGFHGAQATYTVTL